MAKAVIVIWSPKATKSHWVYSEANLAQREGKLVSVALPGICADDLPQPFEVFHLTPLLEWDSVLRSVRDRVSGVLQPPLPKDFDDRYESWAGFWLLNPKQEKFVPSDVLTSHVSLLLARYALVPFLELKNERQDFVDWCLGHGGQQSEKDVCGRVLYGPGGLGKTRLMMEICHQLSDEGWLTGFLERNLIGTGYEVTERKLRRLIEDNKNTRPLLLVVDYAESRASDVVWLCERLIKRRDTGGARARLVLLSRWAGDALSASEGQWWRRLYSEPDVQKIFGTDAAGKADLIQLGHVPDALGVKQRITLFNRSVAAFAEVLRTAGRKIPGTPPTDVQLDRIRNGSDYARPLAVQLEAFLYLFGEAPDEARVGIDELLDRALRLEALSWSKRLGLNNDSTRLRRIGRGVCQTTLATHVDTKESALQLLQADGKFSDEVVDSVHADLHMLFGTQTGGLLPLEPDLIGEHHIA